MITLKDCIKTYTKDQDKAVSPQETVARVKDKLAAHGRQILQETRRIDTGRLGIPVFLSVCGEDARAVMPTRKQMGKGASPEQAEASALMELVERYSFFTHWNTPANFVEARYSEAENGAVQGDVMSLERILQSVGEELPLEQARKVMDLVSWRFHPATDLTNGREEAIPMDWFKTLGEFNGTSAGNTQEESILQGGCELVERHVCAVIDREQPTIPTISLESCRDDAVLADLIDKFKQNGIKVWFKDFTMGMPVPTVGAMAYDPSTHPGLSEIVFTAGTAASPAKAAIRALTEVAQLGGDFETGAIYEASGLSKFKDMDEAAWLLEGPEVSLDSLPSVEGRNIRHELEQLCIGLGEQGYALYSLDTSDPELELCAHYNIVPGFAFRERDPNASLGLFVGRIISEKSDIDEARTGLAALREVYGDAHFVPFFEGMLALREGDYFNAIELFETAEPLQPDADNMALAAFYSSYALTLVEDWKNAIPGLDRALELCPEHKEFYNLRGVCKFKMENYEAAAADFSAALDLDRGSVMDLANLGICCKYLGQKEKAVDFLSTALEIDPTLDFARKHLEELEK